MQQGMDVIGSFLPLIVLFAIFYFLVIRPQQVQAKKLKEMIGALTKGDKVVTNGGFHAEVVKVEDDFLKVKMNDTMIVKLEKDAVARKLGDD